MPNGKYTIDIDGKGTPYKDPISGNVREFDTAEQAQKFIDDGFPSSLPPNGTIVQIEIPPKNGSPNNGSAGLNNSKTNPDSNSSLVHVSKVLKRDLEVRKVSGTSFYGIWDKTLKDGKGDWLRNSKTNGVYGSTEKASIEKAARSIKPDGEEVTLLNKKPTSGAVLQVTPGKTTTVIGSFEDDLEDIFKELNIQQQTGNVQAIKNRFKDGNPGGFNFLNVSTDVYNEAKKNGGDFFENMNAQWIDEAVKRGDRIIVVSDRLKMSNKGKITGFGKEVNRLTQVHGYRWNDDFTELLPPVK